MCADMCIDICRGMCRDTATKIWVDLYKHVYRHVFRHVHGHMCEDVHGHTRVQSCVCVCVQACYCRRLRPLSSPLSVMADGRRSMAVCNACLDGRLQRAQVGCGGRGHSFIAHARCLAVPAGIGADGRRPATPFDGRRRRLRSPPSAVADGRRPSAAHAQIARGRHGP